MADVGKDLVELVAELGETQRQLLHAAKLALPYLVEVHGFNYGDADVATARYALEDAIEHTESVLS